MSPLARIRTWLAPRDDRSFSQCGEDRIVRWVLGLLGIERPRYLDIGAYRPRHLNNTYLFYTLGGSGVLVEANPTWARQIRKRRPRDVLVQAGMGRRAQSGVPFYVMKSDTLCTFSKREAERMVSECREQIRSVESVDIVTPKNVQAEYFRDRLDFVSLDVEGLELEILEAFNFDAGRPAVFCIETISYAINGSGRKAHDLIAYMAVNGYAVHADTYVNTIFVDEERTRSLLQPGGRVACAP